jgi:NAD(P)-dependent dehydrogenase (short-subunit alcohol dehydrogenase family)
MKGKTCLITGANSGLGLCAAKRFAALGARVVLVCRDKDRGARALRDIAERAPDAELELMICDLASVASVKRFIVEFKASHERLDLLFNDAAVWKKEFTRTADGLETMFQVNFLAPFMLCESLLDPLAKSPDPRIINIAAPTASMRLAMDAAYDAARFKVFSSFMRTKLALAIYSVELMRSLSGKVSVFLVEPGPGKFRSNIARELSPILSFLMDIFAKTADRAAQSIEYLATLADPGIGKDRVFFGKKPRPMPAYWSDPENGEKVVAFAKSLLSGIA